MEWEWRLEAEAAGDGQPEDEDKVDQTKKIIIQLAFLHNGVRHLFTHLHQPTSKFTQRCQTPNYTAFIGFEESLAHLPGTCVMGCEPHCQWVRDMLATYNNASFLLHTRENLHTGTDPLCKFDLTTNVQRMGKAMVEQYGLIPNGKEQHLCKLVSDTFLHSKELVHVYDHHYFSPITSTRVMRKNKNTFTIHHFAGSWTGTGNGHWYDHPLFREIINALIQVKRFIKGKK